MLHKLWGVTPLHAAALNGDPAAILALLDAGAKGDAKDTEGNTPLDMLDKSLFKTPIYWRLFDAQ